MTPASSVTAVRGVGALLCTALVGVDLLDHPSSASWILAVVAAPTLLLDIVDGQVAGGRERCLSLVVSSTWRSTHSWSASFRCTPRWQHTPQRSLSWRCSWAP